MATVFLCNECGAKLSPRPRTGDRTIRRWCGVCGKYRTLKEHHVGPDPNVPKVIEAVEVNDNVK